MLDHDDFDDDDEPLYDEDSLFFRNKKSDTIWWLDHPDEYGILEFSFDKKTVFNLFRDYPHKLTPEQRELFDRENPYWADFFKDRSATAELL